MCLISIQVFWDIMSCLYYSTVLIFVFSLILVLCFGISDDDYHECARSCSVQTSSRKTCVYYFFVMESHGITSNFCDNFKNMNESSTCANITMGKNILTINGRIPGPAIQACLGDTIEVFVYNKLGSDELAIHWHGIRQKGYNHMDGVPMITQCPILPYNSFLYKFNPDKAGTYFYHAHSVSQQGDGLYGSIIIRESHNKPSMERILVLSSRLTSTSLLQQPHLYPPIPGELLVNGQAKEVVIHVQHGFNYLLRLINANAHNCPILLSIHGHSLQILSADSNPVQSMTGTHIVLFPGERVDGILKTEKTIGKYALDLEGLLDCRKLHHEAYILYENVTSESHTIRTASNFDEQMLKIAESGHHCHRISRNVICSLDLKSKKSLHMEEADETIYVPFDTNAFSFFTDDMTDNSYNFYTSRYYPAYLSLKKGVTKIPQINGMSFKYPSSLLLLQPENTLEKSMCFDKRSDECSDTPLFCECLQLLQVSSQKTIEILLIDEGFGGNVSHTFHLHGYNASIMGQESFNQPITKDEIISMDRDGKIYRNLVNPVQKDTFVIPNKGYIILRFYTDNLGYWLWEARSTAIYPPLLGFGMQFIMRVGFHRNLPLVRIDFPSCDSSKSNDWLFQ